MGLTLQWNRQLGHFVKVDPSKLVDITKPANRIRCYKDIDAGKVTPQTTVTPRYRGVQYVPDRKVRWRARIKIKGAVVILGHFSTPEAAAKAYDIEAIKLGRKTNFLRKVS